MRPTQRSAGSWWVDADRVGFTHRAEQEMARMATSKFSLLSVLVVMGPDQARQKPKKEPPYWQQESER